MTTPPRPTKLPKRTLRFKSVFLSDIHLGTADCKATQVIHFLRNLRCEKLVLNGDIIDGWSLRRFGKWTRAHTYFIRLILKKMEKEGTDIIYLRGNHDDILWRFLPMSFDRLHIANEHIHESPHGRYLVVHGDGFDATTTRFRWLATLGGYSYGALLRLNRIFASYRRWRGKPAFSLSKAIKAKVKSAVSFIGNYEQQLQSLASAKNCQGIICGHIHTPADKRVGDIHYLNSGDWVESLTAVVEHLDRRFEVISYSDFCRLSNRLPKGNHSTPPASTPAPHHPAEPAAAEHP